MVIIFGWVHVVKLAVFFSSGSQRWYLETGALFIVSSLCFSGFKCFYDDALTELVNHFVNQTLIVFCNKDGT